MDHGLRRTTKFDQAVDRILESGWGTNILLVCDPREGDEVLTDRLNALIEKRTAKL
jgi:hypothetical protein